MEKGRRERAVKRHSILGLRRALALVLLLAVAVVGCGHKTTTVRGKVTYQGTPLTMGSVIMISEDGKINARGSIQSDGNYVITNAPTGKVKVGVANPPPIGARGGQPLSGPPNDPETKQAAELAARYVASPDTYTDPEKSGLSYEVPSGGKTIDIDLKGAVSATPGGPGRKSAPD
jgi:hypothetical protein